MHPTLFIFPVALLILFNLREVNAQCTAIPPVTVTGRFLCHGESLAGPLVLLVHKIGFVASSIGHTRTLEDGSFTVEGLPHWEPDDVAPRLWIFLEYWQRTANIHFAVRQGDEVPITYEGGDTVNMGDIDLSSDLCGAYKAFYNASMDYYYRVGEKNPGILSIQRDETVPIDTPYTHNTEIYYKPGYHWSAKVAQHELAHEIRHHYDGGWGHFWEDVNKYGSPDLVRHDCDTDSNEGFAFNEGWALYWEGACLHSDAGGAHTIEGNVAAALRSLEATCGSSAAQMWQVLKENPGAIHSFSEYRTHHAHLFGCP